MAEFVLNTPTRAARCMNRWPMLPAKRKCANGCSSRYLVYSVRAKDLSSRISGGRRTKAVNLGEVSDLQPAIRDTCAGRTADFARVGFTSGSVDG